MTAKIKRAWYYIKPHTKQGKREPGPHGVTLKMNELSSELGPMSYPTRKEPRDRSLRGKQRRIQRKELQRRPLNAPGDW